MIAKRISFALLFTGLVLLLFPACGSKSSAGAGVTPKVDKVYPFLDAANSRWFFFSSACRPFGMVNLSPDTELNGAWGSGYRYETDTIKGFSHVHAWQMSGLSIMPVLYDVGQETERMTDYFSAFKHQEEKASPGFHQLKLDRYDIGVKLTSTQRVGFHQYDFQQAGQRGLVFNLGGPMGPSRMKGGKLEKVSDKVLRGEVVNAPTRRRPRDFTVFFYIELDQEIGEVTEGPDGKFLVALKGEAKQPLHMKAAISYTSTANAQNNLEQELTAWDFDAVVADSKTEWEEMLSRIDVKGGTEEEQRRFYTDLWHALQGRRVISDANGAYPDNTGESFRVGQLPVNAQGKPLFNHYNSDSFWGAQWTLTTLWGLAYPDIYEEFVNSLLVYYKDGGYIPRGPSGGNYTHVMTGASSTPFIVSAYQKGIQGFDIIAAFEGLKKNHMPGGTMGRAGYEHKTTIGGGLEYYIDKGYVPYPIPEGSFGYHQDGPSLTMEYAYQDWTLAQMAKALGASKDHDYFLARSKNYVNTFDTVIGWMRPKEVDGQWMVDYDPYKIDSGFNESNGAQSTWFVPHDLMGLAELMGGPEAAVEKLNEQFETAEKIAFTAGDRHERETHPEYSRIPINYGNQPSIQTAFVFNHLERPDLTQYWSKRIAQTVYAGLHPNTGYKGDEDQGLMGALAVLVKMGLFQMTGGTEADPVYELGSPSFDRIRIKLHPKYAKGEYFDILTTNNGDEQYYINAMKWNGQPFSGFTLKHSQIIRGGTLELDMMAEPGN